MPDAEVNTATGENSDNEPNVSSRWCSHDDCPGHGTLRIECTYCNKLVDYACIGWPEETRAKDGLEYRCTACQQQPTCFCNKITCSGRGINHIRCTTCSELYHYLCIGWPDEHVFMPRMAYQCGGAKGNTSFTSADLGFPGYISNLGRHLAIQLLVQMMIFK
ncbi:hypothetical protein PR048_003348 [Dryococelus australis]|uniref:PHD-type domain-containing protein n=1 Tax=Dryococelus australis TaxID=614101 RepID=A0ABQ9IMU6_9NEOP|nr:hypothetical protein PR048_003348 [Dryococelus australis]